jgi:Tfp pilus assembly protein PilN
MDNWLALGLTIALVLRSLPYLLGLLSPWLRRRLDQKVARFWALLDVGIGTLMAILVGALLWNRAWLLAALLGAISLPSWNALIAGLRTLARTPR